MNYKNLNLKKIDNVKNIVAYNNEMRKALIDKIFFLDKVGDTNVFIDYGCADGSMLKLASSIIPNAIYVGYDFSNEMILSAEKNNKSIRFTSNFDELLKIINENKPDGNKICLSIMSLIHEVYHYGSKRIKEFWDFVFNPDLFDYIAIRDMCVSRATSRHSDPISVMKIRMNYDKDMVAQWEANWGSLTENWSLVHFLLTYRYIETWDREFRENYLPLNMEDFLAIIPNMWEPIYIEHYTLPFIRQQVMDDFGIDLQDRTHIKLILKRKKQ